MKLPNCDKAAISQDKICNYLLNTAHRRGASKARLLFAMGYTAADWQILESDLRTQHLSHDFAETLHSEYGMRFEIVAAFKDPTG